ncbi:MAG: response regulator [Deltaproteobacteria bacterium]|nr:response regulator [Deltaproteobacteria bacterium]
MSDCKGTVLLVDDDPEVTWGVGRYLTRVGFAVHTCGDGAEAISLLEAGAFDFVVTDIKMPRMNGLALVDWMREHRPSAKVAVMTAFGGPSIRAMSISKGAMLYLEKPVDPEFLADVLTSTSEEKAFSGRIDQIDILDYVQLIMLTGKKLVVEVHSGQGTHGELFVDNGAIIHAMCGELEGEEAVYRCLSFEGGSFLNTPWREPQKVSVYRPGDFLLIEAARKRDERRCGPSGTIEDRLNVKDDG